MTQILENQTAAELERVFGAEGEAVWDTICAHFEFDSGFAYIFVAVPDTFGAEILQRDLSARLELVTAPTQTPAELERLSQWLLTTQATQAIWVGLTKLETDSDIKTWASAMTTATERINEQRDGIRKQQTCPIIFVIAPWVKNLIRVHAPDLWSNRTLSSEMTPVSNPDVLPIEPTTIEAHTTRVLSYLDPDLALAEAEKAKNNPRQQEDYKKLLRRAINGFIGQSQESAENGNLETALELAEKAVALARAQPEEFENELAASVNNLGNRYAALGQREEAFTATLEAVKIRRELARERPDAFNPDLAASLNNLGAMYDALGQRENALTATLEAKNLYEKLARERPDAFNPNLAASLNNLGNRYDALGQRENAFTATLEAVKIRRELARERPDAFNPDLAMSLINLGIRYDALGQRENALTATLEAKNLYEKLARERPDAFNPDLAASLNNLGAMYNALGQRENALTATLEAKNLYEKLARERPDAFNPNLAASLNNLGNRYDALGQRENAFTATLQGAEIFKDLYLHTRIPFSEKYAMSLNLLSNLYRALDQLEQAYDNAYLAVQVLSEVFLQYPQALAQRMIYMLQDYFSLCETLNHEPDHQLLAQIMPVLEPFLQS
jgi:tetratricopeptide (TPR) repeat protein